MQITPLAVSLLTPNTKTHLLSRHVLLLVQQQGDLPSLGEVYRSLTLSAYETEQTGQAAVTVHQRLPVAQN